MFFRNEDFPFPAVLEREAQTVIGELNALPQGDFAPWPGQDLYEGKWNQFPFFVPGKRFEQNIAMCPKTVELVERSIPNCTMAAFALLEPGAHILPHCGFSHAVLRTHLALRVPEGEAWFRVADEKRNWEVGKVFVFDDMYEHEAYNGTKEHRIVLMCDFLRPFRHRTSFLGHFKQRFVLARQMKAQWKRIQEAAQG